MNAKFSRIKNWCISLVIPAVFFGLAACGDNGSTPASGTEQQQYDRGRSAYDSQNYSNAVVLFEQQLQSYPTGDLADDALLYQGRAYYWLEDYAAAETKFTRILNDFATTDQAQAAQYWLAKNLHAQDLFDQARTEYSKVSSTDLIDNAAYQIGRSYFDQAQLTAKQDPAAAMSEMDTAIGLLQDMINRYSTSSSVDDAQFYLARSYHEQAVLVFSDATLSNSTAAELFITAHNGYAILIPSTGSFADDAKYFDARAYHDALDYTNARVGYRELAIATSSSWADDAKYQIGKSYYDEGVNETDATTALGKFSTARLEFSDFEPTTGTWATSTRRDDAAYFKARSIHRQAGIVALDSGLPGTSLPLETVPVSTEITLTAPEYFANARTAYHYVLDAFSNINTGWRDNAQYQIGATYFDEAMIAQADADYALMQQHIAAAIQAFNIVANDAEFRTTNSADNAQYYLGRSYQVIADLATDPSITLLVINNTDFTAVTHQTARDQYAKLLTDPIFANSTWKDNAVYRIGNTYYVETSIELAQPLPDAPTVVTGFNNALQQFNSLLTDPAYADSIRLDNAAFDIGTIYHDACQRDYEQLWFSYLLTLPSASTTLQTSAESHLAELQPTPINGHANCLPETTYGIDLLATP